MLPPAAARQPVCRPAGDPVIKKFQVVAGQCSRMDGRAQVGFARLFPHDATRGFGRLPVLADAIASGAISLAGWHRDLPSPIPHRSRLPKPRRFLAPIARET